MKKLATLSLLLLIPTLILAQSTKPTFIQVKWFNSVTGDTCYIYQRNDGEMMFQDGNGASYTLTELAAGGSGGGAAFVTVADTVALKLVDTTSICYLDALGASGVGGGTFIAIDSTYAEGVIAFNHPTVGQQWVRTEYLEKPNTINALWGGLSVANTGAANSDALDKVCAAARKVKGIIYIPPGTYLRKYNIILDWDSCGIVSNGARLLSSTDHAARYYSGFNYAGVSPGVIGIYRAHGAIIQGINIDLDWRTTSAFNGTGNGIVVDSCFDIKVLNSTVNKVTGASYGIWTRRSKHIDIIRNTVTGDSASLHAPVGYESQNELIEVSQGDCEDVLVADNRLSHSNFEGIYVYNQTVATYGVPGKMKNIRIRGNYLYDCVVGIAIRQFEGSTDFHTISVSDNTIIGSATYGIHVDSQNGSNPSIYPLLYDVDVFHNTVDSCKSGIYVQSSIDVRVDNNSVTRSYGRSLNDAGIIVATDSTIRVSNNTITDPSGIGISVRFGVYNAQIIGNTVDGARYNGMNINGLQWGIISRNKISDCNTSDTSEVVYGSGMYLHTLGDSLIVLDANIIQDTRATKKHLYGIYTQTGYQGANTKVRHNLIKGTLTSSWGGGITANHEIDPPMILGTPGVQDSMLNVSAGVNVEGAMRIENDLTLWGGDGIAARLRRNSAIKAIGTGSYYNFFDLDSVWFRDSSGANMGTILTGNIWSSSATRLTDLTVVGSINMVNVGGGLGLYDGLSASQIRLNSFSATDFTLSSNVFSLNAAKFPTLTGVGELVRDSIAVHSLVRDTSGVNGGKSFGALVAAGKVPLVRWSPTADTLFADSASATGGSGTGDIEGVTAGDGLQGGGTTGTVTLTASPKALGGLKTTGDSLEVDSTKYFTVYAGSLKAPLASPTFTGNPIINLGSDAAGDILYRAITTGYLTRLALGTSGQRLAVGTNAPAWIASDTVGLALALSGKQPIDGDLTAIAAMSATGTVRRTATDTWTATASDTVGLALALAAKAPKDAPTFTTSVTTPLGAGTVRSSAGGLLSATASDSVGLALALSAKAPKDAPTFTTSVTTPLGAGTVRSSSGGLLSSTASDTVGNALALSGKQPIDADLSTLAAPTAWRVFYSDGSSVITQLALGADGTFLKSNGASAAPTFATPAGAGDIEGVTAGDGLQGGGTTGTVTLTNSPKANGGITIIADSAALDTFVVPILLAQPGQVLYQSTATRTTGVTIDTTNLKTTTNPTAWRVFYSNGTSVLTQLALGADGTYLKSNGATSAPTFATPSGSGTDTATTVTYPITRSTATNVVNIGFDSSRYYVKSMVLLQAGTGTDSVLVSTAYRIPLGYSEGIHVDTLVFYGIAASSRSMQYRVVYGTNPSTASTLVDSSTVTSNTAFTRKACSVDIPAGNGLWLEFPIVNTSFKTVGVFVVGKKL